MTKLSEMQDQNLEETKATSGLIPTHFTLTYYQFVLEALDRLELHPFKGSALRGGFGHTFKRLACSQPRRCDNKYCQLSNDCAYGYVFETAPPEGSEVLRNIEGVARPFVIQPPNDRRTSISPGEFLTFRLILVGHSINYLPQFVMVFHELGRIGLGKTRGQYKLIAVDAQSPFDNSVEPIYRAGDELIRVPTATLTTKDITTHAATLPTDRITLDFLAPTKLKHRGQWVNDGPTFEVLVNKLLGRTSSLSYFHCGERLDVDFRGLIDRAGQVKIAQCETHWENWSRFSGRQKQRVDMGGLVGRVTYEGDLQDYLPLLALGELIHVGKGTVFGNGQYKIVMNDER